jgi:hypothetical protein
MCVALLALALSAFCEESAGIAPTAAAFFVVDYLPPAIYEGDALAACFRIENASLGKASFDVTASAVDSELKEIKALTEKVTLAPGAFAPVKFEFDSKRVARITFILKFSGDPKVIADAHLNFLRDHEPWAETSVENGRLMLADGRGVVIPVVQKKRAIEVREFAPVKWLFGASKNDAIAHAGKCAAFVPGAWKLNATGAHTLGPWALDGSIPILNAMNQVMSELRSVPVGEYKRAVILLPPEDLDLATDPRTYRVVLDALLARLTQAQIGRIVLIAPFKYGCNDAHRKALWREIHESATVNTATVLDPLDWLHNAQWRVDSAVPNVFGRSPNAAGRKMIEQAVTDLIR